MASPERPEPQTAEPVEEGEPRVLIYTRTTCRYCVRAKELCQREKLAYREMVLDEDCSKADMEAHVGHACKTVPQIFLDGQHIGGFTEFEAHWQSLQFANAMDDEDF